VQFVAERLCGVRRGPVFGERQVGQFIEVAFLRAGLRRKAVHGQYAHERGGEEVSFVCGFHGSLLHGEFIWRGSRDYCAGMVIKGSFSLPPDSASVKKNMTAVSARLVWQSLFSIQNQWVR